MKKITLTESDLLMIVKRVLNEQKKRRLQKDRQFDEDEIDILHHIFERELKPPFSKGDKDIYDRDTYHNRDGRKIGCLIPSDIFIFEHYPFWLDIKYKVCQVFGFSTHGDDWWRAIKPHLKSWLSDQLNIHLNNL